MCAQAKVMQTVTAAGIAVMLVMGPATSVTAGDDQSDFDDTPFLLVLVGGSLGPPTIDPQRCPTPKGSPGPALRVDIASTGYGSIVGAVSETQSHCIDPNGPNPLLNTNGQVTIKDATGDLLFGKYKALLVPTPTTAKDGVIMIRGEYCNNGGTGKYANAHGCAIAVGQFNTATGASIVSLEGALKLGVLGMDGHN
jgi:hypothetical protein